MVWTSRASARKKVLFVGRVSRRVRVSRTQSPQTGVSQLLASSRMESKSVGNQACNESLPRTMGRKGIQQGGQTTVTTSVHMVYKYGQELFLLTGLAERQSRQRFHCWFIASCLQQLDLGQATVAGNSSSSVTQPCESSVAASRGLH